MTVSTTQQFVLNWLAQQPGWLRDLVSRLVDHDALGQDDLEAFAARLLDQDTPREDGPVELKIAAPAQMVADVKILAIEEPRNLGVLEPDQSLTVGADGLTLIRGPNGTGKSTWASVLKVAGRSNDPKAALRRRSSAPAAAESSATLSVSVAGQKRDVLVSEKRPVDDIGVIHVFDAPAAKRYVQKGNELPYRPEHLDLLADIGRALCQLKTQLENGRPDEPSVGWLQLERLHGGRAPRLADLDIAVLRERVELSKEERSLLATLETRAAEPERIRQGVQMWRSREATLRDLVDELQRANEAVRETPIRRLAEQLRQAREAADGLRLDDGSVPMSGVGSETWRALWNASRTFWTDTSRTEDWGERCPLCQQSLDAEARERFELFARCVDEEAEERVHAMEARVEAECTSLRNIARDLNDLSTHPELKTDSQLADWIEACRKALETLVGGAECAPLAEPPLGAMREQLEDARGGALELEAALDSATTDTDETLGALRHRRHVMERIEEVEAAVEAAKLRDAYDLATSLVTKTSTSVSRQARKWTDAALKEPFVKAVQAELGALELDRLELQWPATVSHASASFTVKLAESKKTKPSDVLSEGEQRGVALAFFLAELAVAEDDGPVVFDDPMSSLDGERRSLLAARLVDLARHRQVIVLTHDPVFVVDAYRTALERQVEIQYRRLERIGSRIGVASEEALEAGAKQFIQSADRDLQCLEAQTRGGQEPTETAVRGVIASIRQGWERAIEECIFADVVRRYDPRVRPSLFHKMVLDREVHERAYASWSECSRYLHDAGVADPRPVPELSVVRGWLETLRKFRSDCIARQKRLPLEPARANNSR